MCVGPLLKFLLQEKGLRTKEDFEQFRSQIKRISVAFTGKKPFHNHREFTSKDVKEIFGDQRLQSMTWSVPTRRLGTQHYICRPAEYMEGIQLDELIVNYRPHCNWLWVESACLPQTQTATMIISSLALRDKRVWSLCSTFHSISETLRVIFRPAYQDDKTDWQFDRHDLEGYRTLAEFTKAKHLEFVCADAAFYSQERTGPEDTQKSDAEIYHAYRSFVESVRQAIESGEKKSVKHDDMVSLGWQTRPDGAHPQVTFTDLARFNPELAAEQYMISSDECDFLTGYLDRWRKGGEWGTGGE